MLGRLSEMKSLWSDQEAASWGEADLLGQRVYTSQLLGRDDRLVQHGGGNTSVKVREKTFFGDEEELLYVKGSGWDLETIAKEGFAPIRMETLLKLAELEQLSDSDMVKQMRAGMTDPSAPNGSVEADSARGVAIHLCRSYPRQCDSSIDQ